MQLAQLLLGDRRRRSHQQVFRVLRHRERDDFANVRLFRQQHHDTVDSRRQAAVRRRAISKCIQHAAEPLLDFLRPVAGDFEGAQHDVGPMVPDRAARQLDAVADDVVLERFNRQRILCVERLEPALRHRERIVAEGHLSGFRIALVERKVGNPAELVGARLDDVELPAKMCA